VLYADWKDVDAYYAGSSSAKRIPQVSIPLLCIQAADDPIAPEEAIPYAAIQQNPNCTLVVTPCGGHLGWAAGRGEGC
jgi:predicted alpha/beta-fold hydrolase